MKRNFLPDVRLSGKVSTSVVKLYFSFCRVLTFCPLLFSFRMREKVERRKIRPAF